MFQNSYISAKINKIFGAVKMKNVDLEESQKHLYFVCLEDWSDEMKESGNHKECWYEKMKDKGLRVKIAVDESGTPGGMIQYLPIERSHAEGEGLYFINCIWVHGYKHGRGDFRKQGMGEALLKAAEEDAKALGASGIAAWGLSLPFWMKASWFKKYGYKKADSQGMMQLVWKPFSENAKAPKWLPKTKVPFYEPVAGKVSLTLFKNGWCPAMNIVHERTKRAAAEFSDKVEITEIDTIEKDAMRKYGISDAVFIDGKELRNGPPPSFEKIRKKIGKKVVKLKVKQ
jgi:GNAT superfamily N-acetyltransferase